MLYCGGKTRIKHHITRYLARDREKGQLYIEPFVGGGNVISCFGGERIGYDINKYMIAFLRKVIQEGIDWIPKKVDAELFAKVKKNKDQDLALSGYIGFNFSYGGNFFTTFRNSYKGKRDGQRDYSREGIQHVLNHCKYLRSKPGLKFIRKNYQNISMQKLRDSFVYCDPPYFQTYHRNFKFDSHLFWEWACDIPAKTLFVSEASIPDEFKSKFKIVWQMDYKSTLKQKTSMTRKEILFKRC